MRQGSEPRLLVAGLMIAALALVLFFMVGKPIIAAFTRMRMAATKRSVFALPTGPKPVHVRGVPIPTGPDVPEEMDFRVKYVAWFNRAVTAHYPTNDPKGAAYIRSAVDYIGADYQISAYRELVATERSFDIKDATIPTVAFTDASVLSYSTKRADHHTPTYQALLATERSFDLKDVTDPGLALMIGLIEPDAKRQRDAINKAVAEMPGSNYPKFIWFLAAASAGHAAALDNADSDDMKARDALSLKYLEAGLNDGSFQPGEALRWRFNAKSVQDLFFRNGVAAAQIFAAARDVAPWVKDYVEGVQYTQAAWAARGTNSALNISQPGWNEFAEKLAIARNYLVTSWNENPHDPAAAAEMIRVCMGENEDKDKMRTWFDRSVAADCDFNTAYLNFERGLEPRWVGSYLEMNAFGEECAATGRYDTSVPYQRVQVALDISADAADHGAQFRDPRVAMEVLDVINKYFAESNPPIAVQYNHTLAAIIAEKIGNVQEMKKHMAAIQYTPLRAPLLAQMMNLQVLIRDARGN
jgi:hypothetical protein